MPIPTAKWSVTPAHGLQMRQGSLKALFGEDQVAKLAVLTCHCLRNRDDHALEPWQSLGSDDTEGSELLSERD